MLKTPLRLLLAASVALPGSLAFSAAAGAGGYYGSHNYYGGHSGYGHHGGYRHHYGGYSGYRHHGGYYYGGSRHHYRGHSGHHGHGHAGRYLGVAILGLGLGYGIAKSRDRDYYDDGYRGDYYRNDNNYQGGYATPPPPGYRGQDEAQDQPYSAQSFDFSQCGETREYQTTIFIDGQEQQAFGTACLMPDGTWIAGPMQIEP